MIPILYNGTEQDFLSNGLGRLSDAITCKVTEERNGQFELVMTYPISGIHYADIAENAIIYAKTEDGGNNQAFIIYKISKPLNGIITINAEHISYLLNGFIVEPFSAVSCADAVSKIGANIQPADSPFRFHTDVQTGGAFTLAEPRNARGLLGGEQGSLLDVYGAKDYKFDNFNVYLLENRGYDNGVSIRYGKNLTDLKNVVDTTNVYTGIMPYWADDTTYISLPEKVVMSEHAADYPYKIIKPVDFRSDFETAPTEAQLRARAESYLASNAPWKLKNSIDISFVSLGQTEEYKQFKALERVKLCDYVTVIYDKLGVNVKTKVIKTVYDVLLEKYDTISLGDTTYTLAKAIQGAIDLPTQEQVSNSIANAVSRATKLIQGGLGGHVVFNTNGDGEPQEILIMDTDDIATAVNVIRMNLNGIGFSHNGYNGPFETAWTIDGHFVANFIDTGELNGNLIKANTVAANALTVQSQIDSGMIHSYVPIDLLENSARWTSHYHGSGGISWGISYIYVDGVRKDAIRMDGTSLSDPNYSSSLSFFTDLVGNVPLHIKFKYQVKQTVTITNRMGLLIYYIGGNGQSWGGAHLISLEAGTVLQADTEYIVDEVESTGATATLEDQSRFDFSFIQQAELYIYDIEITSSSYKKALLEYSSNGLNSTVMAGTVISQINQSAEQVSIKANKIDLTGDLSLHGDFTSYAPNDNTTYAFMDSGTIEFYNQDTLMFTIAATAWQGQYAGIYFGDAQDFARYTHMNQDYIVAPTLYVRGDGSQSVPTGAGDALVEGDFSVHGSSHFYSNVYDSGGGVVFVSDKRKKKSIKDLALEKARSFLMALTPRAFKFKDGTSGRYHHGFIAQEVNQAMGGDDWGVYVEDEKNDFIGLRYDEIIADLVKVVQEQEKRIDALERKLGK